LSNINDQINIESLENASYEQSKEQAFETYNSLLRDINGNDLAAKKKAIKELPAEKNKIIQLNKPKLQSHSTLTTITAKMEF
jgi:hypothetical protein